MIFELPFVSPVMVNGLISAAQIRSNRILGECPGTTFGELFLGLKLSRLGGESDLNTRPLHSYY